MISKFEARTAYNAGVDIYSETITKTWRMPGADKNHGDLYWYEDDQLFHIETEGQFDEYSLIFRLSSTRLVALSDGEVRVVSDKGSSESMDWIQNYLVSEQGILFYSNTDALWVTTESSWDTGQIASDELSFSEISPNGIARGIGWQGSDHFAVALNLTEKKILKSAYFG
ncbi:MAG: hypothetical protein WCI55_17000 [Armatimonadota bacterium]